MKLIVYPHLICNCHRLIWCEFKSCALKTDGVFPLDEGGIKSSSFGEKCVLDVESGGGVANKASCLFSFSRDAMHSLDSLKKWETMF